VKPKLADLKLLQINTRNTAMVWLGLVVFIILLIGVLLPIHPEDYWWYVRLGQEITATGQIPTVDQYSYTRTGQPIVYHSWLSALLLWQIHAWGGPTLTVLIRAILIALAYALVWQTCRIVGAGPRLASGITLLAALSTSNNWTIRPQTFSYPLFALVMLILWQQQHHRDRLLWLLPLVMALWVNLHGAFILAFLLVGAMLIARDGHPKTTLIVLGMMVLATLLNPRFVGAWTYLVTLLTDPSSQQLGTEWRPPVNEGWQAHLFFGWFLLLIPLAAISTAKLRVTQWLWYLIFGWMALSGLRYVIWFSMILAPLTVTLLVPQIGHHIDAKRVQLGIPFLNRAIVGILLIIIVPFLPIFRHQWWSAAPPVMAPNVPVEAVTWLATEPDLPGPLWSHISFSSYLIFALPSRPVWADTRLELYPLEHSQRYLIVSNGEPRWQAILDEENINLMMVDQDTQANLYTLLIDSKTWQKQYKDEQAAIFMRVSQLPQRPRNQ